MLLWRCRRCCCDCEARPQRRAKKSRVALYRWYRLCVIVHIAIDGAISAHLFKFINFVYEIDKHF